MDSLLKPSTYSSSVKFGITLSYPPVLVIMSSIMSNNKPMIVPSPLSVSFELSFALSSLISSLRILDLNAPEYSSGRLLQDHVFGSFSLIPP